MGRDDYRCSSCGPGRVLGQQLQRPGLVRRDIYVAPTGVYASIGFRVASAPLPGDANGDGKVDINDLTIVLTNFGQTGTTWSQGDFNGDGHVDVNDLTIVLSNFGTTDGAGNIKAVPEPSAMAILLAGGACLVAFAWQRKS